MTSGAPVPDQIPLRELMRDVVAGRRRRLAVLVVLSLLGGFAEATTLVLIARIGLSVSDSAQSQVTLGPLGDLDLSIGTMILLAGALTVARFGFQALASWNSALLTREALVDIRKRMMRAFLGASWAVQSKERQGVLQELMTTYAMQWTNVLSTVLQGTAAFCGLAALMATAFAVNAIGALAVLGAVAILLLVLRPFRGIVRRQSSRTAQANVEFATTLTEFAATTQEIRVFNVEDEVRRRTDASIDAHGRAFVRNTLLAGILPGVYQTAALLFVVIALGVIYELDPGTLGALGAIVLMMVRSLSYGQLLQSVYQSLYHSAPYLERLQAQEGEYLRSAVSRGGASIEAINELEFDHVSFEYERGVSVLHDVSFRLPRGEIVGIVGPSGSGKSTLVQLLLRLRQPSDGTVMANGVDVDKLSLDDWYERVAFVSQDSHLINGTIAENIAFFRDDVSEQQVEQASRLAHLHEDVAGFPEGYDTPVGERGSQLSGGQQQRLCIARALVGRPDLIVLDEPTSSLDVKSESLVRDTLHTLESQATVVIIAHRLSTLHICKRIMVLLGGRVEGFDESEVLETSNPFYREALRLSGLST